MSETTGVIFDLQRWSTDDGPGIRTTVFFKGCPLRCVWCCNPESWSPQPQLGVFADRCQGCGSCVASCAHGMAKAGEVSDGCHARGDCVGACPHGARQMFGQRVTDADVFDRLMRDAVFHRASGGGVTFSGGEATAQPRLLHAFATRLHAAGVHLVLETCGHFAWEENEAALQLMDLIYLDLKHLDPREHARLTGVGNELILANAERLIAADLPLVFRVPLIPGLNDSPEQLARVAAFAVEGRRQPLPVEVLPYHALGKGKYRALGLSYPCETCEPPSGDRLEAARGIFRKAGVPVRR